MVMIKRDSKADRLELRATMWPTVLYYVLFVPAVFVLITSKVGAEAIEWCYDINFIKNVAQLDIPRLRLVTQQFLMVMFLIYRVPNLRSMYRARIASDSLRKEHRANEQILQQQIADDANTEIGTALSGRGRMEPERRTKEALYNELRTKISEEMPEAATRIHTGIRLRLKEDLIRFRGSPYNYIFSFDLTAEQMAMLKNWHIWYGYIREFPQLWSGPVTPRHAFEPKGQLLLKMLRAATGRSIIRTKGKVKLGPEPMYISGISSVTREQVEESPYCNYEDVDVDLIKDTAAGKRFIAVCYGKQATSDIIQDPWEEMLKRSPAKLSRHLPGGVHIKSDFAKNEFNLSRMKNILIDRGMNYVLWGGLFGIVPAYWCWRLILLDTVGIWHHHLMWLFFMIFMYHFGFYSAPALRALVARRRVITWNTFIRDLMDVEEQLEITRYRQLVQWRYTTKQTTYVAVFLDELNRKTGLAKFGNYL